MSELDDDIARGCLKDGEPIEARWGVGWWSEADKSREPEWGGGECPYCGQEAHYYGDEFVECEHCLAGKKES
jgi:hypothetical protein